MIQLLNTGDAMTEKSPYQFGTWYPIESALKENTEGDVWVECPDFQGHRVADCVFQGGEWWRGLTPINAVRRGDTFLIKATHWMPLPPPPSQGDRSNEPKSDAASLKQT